MPDRLRPRAAWCRAALRVTDRAAPSPSPVTGADILDALATAAHPLSTEAIAATAGASWPRAARILAALRKEGRVRWFDAHEGGPGWSAADIPDSEGEHDEDS
ncbi:helix-turn-helix domain-containing protein [Sphingomonas sp. BE137]|uniref:helix-turn-helix domain-containing protein n=1 Tax=Sphingomonas sp. BE137 TaxID=2817844 RepID=UPI001AE55190|nr:helix-turn-helix domain-containing protein [Sphingomonas sp. BE137]MDR6850349.1 hypothetical protein [Sphingomonas sp. BE137]